MLLNLFRNRRAERAERLAHARFLYAHKLEGWLSAALVERDAYRSQIKRMRENNHGRAIRDHHPEDGRRRA